MEQMTLHLELVHISHQADQLLDKSTDIGVALGLTRSFRLDLWFRSHPVLGWLYPHLGCLLRLRTRSIHEFLVIALVYQRLISSKSIAPQKSSPALLVSTRRVNSSGVPVKPSRRNWNWNKASLRISNEFELCAVEDK
jgi:hypothetical protein